MVFLLGTSLVVYLLWRSSHAADEFSKILDFYQTRRQYQDVSQAHVDITTPAGAFTIDAAVHFFFSKPGKLRVEFVAVHTRPPLIQAVGRAVVGASLAELIGFTDQVAFTNTFTLTSTGGVTTIFHHESAEFIRYPQAYTLDLLGANFRSDATKHVAAYLFRPYQFLLTTNANAVYTQLLGNP